MAGSTMKDIKLRIRSVESTKQITNAMQLVASSKLRKARQRMEQTRPYLRISQQVIADIASHNLDEQPPFFCEQARRGKVRYVVIAGRPRTGRRTTTHTVFKLADELMDENNLRCCPWAKRRSTAIPTRGCRLLSDEYARTEHGQGSAELPRNGATCSSNASSPASCDEGARWCTPTLLSMRWCRTPARDRRFCR